MALTEQQRTAIERLYENESLTDNLTDDDAQAVLQWAQQQITADNDGALVAAAVSAANQSGQAGAQALVAQASTFLAQELNTRTLNTARAQDLPAATTMNPTPSTGEATRERKAEEMGALPNTVQASGEISKARILTARADATTGSGRSVVPASPKKSMAKKSRRKSKRTKKK